MKKLLLVIDVQSYYLDSKPSDLPARIAGYIQKSDYDAVAFTVVHNTAYSNLRRSLKWKGCIDNSDLVLPKDFGSYITAENVFEKHTFSPFKLPDFIKYLQSHTIDSIDICGIYLEDCVLATAFDAFDQNYTTNVLFDLVETHDPSARIAVEDIIKRDILAKE